MDGHSLAGCLGAARAVAGPGESMITGDPDLPSLLLTGRRQTPGPGWAGCGHNLNRHGLWPIWQLEHGTAQYGGPGRASCSILNGPGSSWRCSNSAVLGAPRV